MLKHHQFRAKPGKMKELIALYKELAARADVVVPGVPHRVYREAVGDHDILHVFAEVPDMNSSYNGHHVVAADETCAALIARLQEVVESHTSQFWEEVYPDGD
jgi:hypothetical protein